MKYRLTTALAVLIPLLTSNSASAASDTTSKPSQCKNIGDAIKATLASETRGTWHHIQWRTNANQALAEAAQQKKPIFVFFVVKNTGHGADSNNDGKT